MEVLNKEIKTLSVWYGKSLRYKETHRINSNYSKQILENKTEKFPKAIKILSKILLSEPAKSYQIHEIAEESK